MKTKKKDLERIETQDKRKAKIVAYEQEIEKIKERLISLSKGPVNGNTPKSVNKQNKRLNAVMAMIADFNQKIQLTNKQAEKEEQEEAAAKVIRDRREKLRLTTLDDQCEATINTIVKVLNDPEYTIEDIESECFRFERNKSFEISGNIDFRLELPSFSVKGDKITSEHVNGRTNIGNCYLAAKLNDEIKTIEDINKWHKRFSVWIETTPEFNQYVEKFQNAEENITAEIYAKCYEDFNHVTVSKEDIQTLRLHSLSSKYSKTTKRDVINLIILKYSIKNR